MSEAAIPLSAAIAGEMRVNALINAIPHPILMVGPDGEIVFVNSAAEQFFAAGTNILLRQTLADLLPFGSPLIQLVDQVRAEGNSVNEYGIDIVSPRIGEHQVDVQVAPVIEQPGCVAVIFQERTIALKMDRQLTHRGAARSVMGMAAVLAHEIKNPLSGIRGAAQLLEQSVPREEVQLTRLICDETDRIRKLVDRMEVFSDSRPVERDPVNIHEVLEYVRQLALNGFAKNIKITEEYDPSLPPVLGNRDQLIQVLLNLVKNAAEAVDSNDGEITLTTAYRPGVRLSVPGSRDRVTLPLEICVKDNGPGVPDDIRPHLFDPFVTTKSSGTGLGLALVAKIVGDHGGVIECETQPRKTVFRILMPMHSADAAAARTTLSETEA